MLSPEALQALLLSDDVDEELALLDVREARQANRAHLNLARHAPLSTLELGIRAFVPRLGTPIVLYDEDDAADGPAARAAAVLEWLGYRDVRRLAGGLRAWMAQGRIVIDGNSTLVKAFGDAVRKHYGTPTLPLEELEARQRAGRPTTLIDVRPRGEYAFLSIAGARNYPGTELALRSFSNSQEGGDHLWAINCFSRTRGIIGTTTLRLLGRSHNAVFVEDGVMAWGLRGAPVVQNARALDDLPAESPELLRPLANALIARHGLRRIDADGLSRLQADAARTLYLFDVRPPEAAAQPPVPSVRNVAGGQVLMHFENLVGTRHARIVLIDDAHGLRAAITAFWLTQLNQAEVYVLDGALPAAFDAAARTEVDDATHAGIDADALAARMAQRRVDIVDVGPSLDYERQHLPGAWFLLPASLAPLEPLAHAPDAALVFTSPDGAAARLAARDAQARWPEAEIDWLEGGTQAWQAGGRAVESAFTPQQLLTPFDDDWGSVMRVFGPRRDAVWADYLAWERALGERVVADPTVRFKLF